GFLVDTREAHPSDGYFAASADARRAEFLELLHAPGLDALIGMRGGYGSNYLLDASLPLTLAEPKAIIGFSDLTSLQIFLWQQRRWVTFYGPMVAAGFDGGADAPAGYDETSLRMSISQMERWSTSLRGDALVGGKAEGRLLGGAMTIV